MKIKKLVLITRTLMGLLLVIFVLDIHWGFLPERAMSEEGEQFLSALRRSGYVMPLVTAIQLVAGLCLLGGYFAPLALALFAPLLVNILLFHLKLNLLHMGFKIIAVCQITINILILKGLFEKTGRL